MPYINIDGVGFFFEVFGNNKTGWWKLNLERIMSVPAVHSCPGDSSLLQNILSLKFLSSTSWEVVFTETALIVLAVCQRTKLTRLITSRALV